MDAQTVNAVCEVFCRHRPHRPSADGQEGVTKVGERKKPEARQRALALK